MSLLNTFKSLSADKQLSILLHYQDTYENGGDDQIDDATFDILVNIYETQNNRKYQKVGFAPKTNEVPLPYYMGSLDKAKGPSAKADLDRWSKTYKGPWVLEDKIDGTAGLYVVNHLVINNEKITIQKLYTRGDGTVGSDISHLIRYLNLPVPPIDIAVRGEIVLHFKDFEEYKLQYNSKLKATRNAGTGVINSKDINEVLASKLKFYGYNILRLSQNGTELEIPNQETQLYYLKSYGILVPWYTVIDTLEIPMLEKYLQYRRETAEYDIDGIVLSDNKNYPLLEDRNPRHMIAFKVDSYTMTLVTDVIWEPSKDGVLKPVVIYEPVVMSGVTMTRASGKNAKFIISNGIGPGAIILITRAGDVIPDIVECLEPVSEENLKLPYMGTSDMDESYTWNRNGIEFVLVNKDSNVKVQCERIEYFIKTMDIKNVGPGRIALLYDHRFDTLHKLLSAVPDDMASIPGLGFKSADQIWSSIQDVINSAPLTKLMAASGVFGPGFGVRKMEMVVKAYPNILEYATLPTSQLVDMIQSIEGFDKTSYEFAINLPKFIEWLYDHPMIKVVIPSQKIEGTTLTGMKVVFTGFRSEELEDKIKRLGGSVASSMSKSTTLLVAKSLADLKTKGAKADELGIPVMSLSEFRLTYNL